MSQPARTSRSETYPRAFSAGGAPAHVPIAKVAFRAREETAKVPCEPVKRVRWFREPAPEAGTPESVAKASKPKAQAIISTQKRENALDVPRISASRHA
jgi:hypothetical protein